MDKYAFLLELNSNLAMKISGNEIKGDLGKLFFNIAFTKDLNLSVSTKVFLFGDYPLKDHIQAAYDKTSCFSEYVLENEYFNSILKQGSSFKLVQGYFGGGKTHFLLMIAVSPLAFYGGNCYTVSDINMTSATPPRW